MANLIIHFILLLCCAYKAAAIAANTNPVTNECPTPCICLEPLIDCSKRNLRQIPTNLPKWVESLELQNNYIRSIDPALRNLPRLRKLDLSNNQLTTDNDDEFAWWWNNFPASLQKLTLDNNKLQTLLPPPSAALEILSLSRLKQLSARNNRISTPLFKLRQRLLSQILPSLSTLDLSYNNISILSPDPAELFAQLDADTSEEQQDALAASSYVQHRQAHPLQKLFLSGNNLILSLYKESFIAHTMLPITRTSNNFELEVDLNNLEQLDLSHGRLASIDGLAFSGLESLEKLDLSHNRLVNLSDGAFYGLPKVQMLRLSHNQLDVVRKGWTYGLQQCQQLDLSHNRIAHIEQRVWELAPALHKLFLASNRLGFFNSDGVADSNNTVIEGTDHYFTHLNELRVLDLSNNGLEVLDEHAFSHCPQLRVLMLAHNRLAWLVEDHQPVVDDDITASLPSLKSSSTMMSSSNPFLGLTRLQHLSLANNSIQIIPAYALDYLFAGRIIDSNSNNAEEEEDDDPNAKAVNNKVPLSPAQLLHAPATVQFDVSLNPIVHIDAQRQGVNFVIAVDAPLPNHGDGDDDDDNVDGNAMMMLPENSVIGFKSRKTGGPGDDDDDDLLPVAMPLRRLRQQHHSSSTTTNNREKSAIVVRVFASTDSYNCNCRQQNFQNLLKQRVVAVVPPTSSHDIVRSLQQSQPSPGAVSTIKVVNDPKNKQNFRDLIVSHMQCQYPLAVRDFPVLKMLSFCTKNNAVDVDADSFSPPLPILSQTTTIPRDLTNGVVVGNSVVMKCTAQLRVLQQWLELHEPHSDSLLKFSWQKDRRQSLMPSSLDIKSFRDVITVDKLWTVVQVTTTLTIDHVQEEHAGQYQCIAHSEQAGVVYGPQTMNVNVHILPRFTKQPRALVVVPVGHSIQLECAAEGRPRPVISWKRTNDADDTSAEKASASFPAAKNRRLRFDGDALILINATQEDAGVYICTAESNAGTVACNATVRVLGTMSEYVEFMQKQQHQQQSSGSNIHENRNFPLYTKNSAAESPSSKKFPIDAEIPPVAAVATAASNTNIVNDRRVIAGGNAALECSSTATSAAAAVAAAAAASSATAAGTSSVTSITWLRNGQIVRADNDKHVVLNDGNLLLIINAQVQDAGLYTCRVSTKRVMRPAASSPHAGSGKNNNDAVTTITTSTYEASVYLDVIHPQQQQRTAANDEDADDANDDHLISPVPSRSRSSSKTNSNRRFRNEEDFPLAAVSQSVLIVICAAVCAIAAVLCVVMVICVRARRNNNNQQHQQLQKSSDNDAVDISNNLSSRISSSSTATTNIGAEATGSMNDERRLATAAGMKSPLLSSATSMHNTNNNNRFNTSSVAPASCSMIDYSPGTTETYLTPSSLAVRRGGGALSSASKIAPSSSMQIYNDPSLLLRSGMNSAAAAVSLYAVGTMTSKRPPLVLVPENTVDEIYAGVGGGDENSTGSGGSGSQEQNVEAFFTAAFSPPPPTTSLAHRERLDYFRRAQSLRRSLSQQKINNNSNAVCAAAQRHHEDNDDDDKRRAWQQQLRRQLSYGNLYGVADTNGGGFSTSIGQRSSRHNSGSSKVKSYAPSSSLLAAAANDTASMSTTLSRTTATGPPPVIDRSNKPKIYATTTVINNIGSSSATAGVLSPPPPLLLSLAPLDADFASAAAPRMLLMPATTTTTANDNSVVNIRRHPIASSIRRPPLLHHQARAQQQQYAVDILPVVNSTSAAAAMTPSDIDVAVGGFQRERSLSGGGGIRGSTRQRLLTPARIPIMSPLPPSALASTNK